MVSMEKPHWASGLGEEVVLNRIAHTRLIRMECHSINELKITPYVRIRSLHES